MKFAAFGSMLDAAGYYGAPEVRERILEYCGVVPGGRSAFGIAAYGGTRGLRASDDGPEPIPMGELDLVMAEGADVCRSLADRGGTLLQLDLDLASPADRGRYLRDPEEAFARLEPLYRAAREELAARGIRPFALMTGKGYHLVARVPLGTPFHRELVALGRLGEPLAARYAALEAAIPGATVLGRAHDGAGRLVEFLCGRIAARAAPASSLPIALADVPPPDRSPFLCLDLSAYADPLFARHVRCAFSLHQKAAMHGLAADVPAVICVPRDETPLEELLEIRRDSGLARALARATSTRIPDVDGDDLRPVRAYRASALARFHAECDAGTQDPPSSWPATYDAFDLTTLPPCIRAPLEKPNPALLEPAGIRNVTLVLLALGWHPRSIAGLVRSKYERDHGWGDLWYRYDAAARADFYVRVLSGAVAIVLDRGDDFDCAGQRERGLCPLTSCGRELRAHFRPARARIRGDAT
jgi:hypothetical protein